MITCAHLAIKEAQCHGSQGWLECDKWFQQRQAALASPQPWQELNSSLHISLLWVRRLWREAKAQCTPASLQLSPLVTAQSTMAPTVLQLPRRPTRLEMLECLCSSWNKGRCVSPGSCRFCRVCATCKHKGHRARECKETG